MKLYKKMPGYSPVEMVTKLVRECVPLFGFDSFADYLGIHAQLLKEIFGSPEKYKDHVEGIFKKLYLEPKVKELTKCSRGKPKSIKKKCLGLGCNKEFKTSMGHHFCPSCRKSKLKNSFSENEISGARLSDAVSEIKAGL